MDINGTRAPPTATDLLDLPDYAGRDFLEASGGGLSFTAQEPVFCCSVVVAAVVVVVDCILLYFTVLYLQVVRKLACASVLLCPDPAPDLSPGQLRPYQSVRMTVPSPCANQPPPPPLPIAMGGLEKVDLA